MAVVAQQLQQPAGDGVDDFEAMFAVWCELDPPVGYRAEISEGAIRMNPLPAKGHALIASISSAESFFPGISNVVISNQTSVSCLR